MNLQMMHNPIMTRHDSQSTRLEFALLLADIVIMQWICFCCAASLDTPTKHTKAKWKRCHKSKRSQAAPATGWSWCECCRCRCCCDSQGKAGGGKGARRDRGGEQGSCRLIRALSRSLSLANHIVGATDLPLTWRASAWTCTWALAAVAVAAAADVDAGSVQDKSVSSRLAQSAMRDPVAAIVGCQGLSSVLSCCCCSLRYSL